MSVLVHNQDDHGKASRPVHREEPRSDSWAAVERLFAGLPNLVSAGVKVAIYGPFNYGGRYTSDSNAAFDRSLKEKAPHQGVRDFENVDVLAAQGGLTLIEDRAMPSNNRCLLGQVRG
jgi:hypothetical protein